MRRRRTQAHEKEVQRLFEFVAVGIGIAFGIEITIDGHFNIDADSDPDTDSDAGVSRYQLYFRDRNQLRAISIPSNKPLVLHQRLALFLWPS